MILRSILFITLLACITLTSVSCDDIKDDLFSDDPSGTFLKINNDSRIMAGGGSGLTLEKSLFVDSTVFQFDNEHKIALLGVDDPENFLISGFGGYDFDSTLTIRFAVPFNLENGSYSTTEKTSGELLSKQMYGELISTGEFTKTLLDGGWIEYEKEGTSNTFEFQDLKFLSGGDTATVSGRLIIRD